MHIVVKTPFEAFSKIKIFTKTGRTQSLRVWSNSDSNLPPEDGQNKKSKYSQWKKISHQAIQISQNEDPICFDF